VQVSAAGGPTSVKPAGQSEDRAPEAVYCIEALRQQPARITMGSSCRKCASDVGRRCTDDPQTTFQQYKGQAPVSVSEPLDAQVRIFWRP
jgi:hypothetical protein